MIRFERVDEPGDFDEWARVPGNAWLAANPEGRPKDYWTRFKGALAEGFRNLCAYSAMYEPVGTVDQSGELSHDGLERKAPLIAAAIDAPA